MQPELRSPTPDWENINQDRAKQTKRHNRKISKLHYPAESIEDFEPPEERFDPLTTPMNKGNFTIPGEGQKPCYCHTRSLTHMHKSGNGAASTFKTCKLLRCPCCGQFKTDSLTFKNSVLVECYALVTGDRPFRYIGSMHTDVQDNVTLKDIRNFKRNVKDRVKRQGVTAGIQIFHPFRLKKHVQDAIRVLNGENTTSGGFWSYVRNPSNIEKINAYLGTEYRNWRDCSNLSIHVHGLGFPSHQKITGDKKVVIRKLQKKDGTYTLETTTDLVKHIRYLMTHAGALTNVDDESRMQACTPFGDLHNWKPEEYLTQEEIQGIQADVLQVLNENRTKPYTFNAKGELCYLGDEATSDEKLKDQGYYPLHELFDAYDEFTAECRQGWLSSITNEANLEYVLYLMSERSRILDDKTIPQKLRCLFLQDLKDPPDSFEIIELDW
ncbi:hypothetical protein [Methanolobus sp. WCC4]|uniref:hypothetical protein n=1 Tax=Methanolobus sp. WCC4 TaxID=3125784 RepID=UPI0030FBEA3C